MPKVSVILPAYNVEKSVRRAVESVLAQDLGDLELICVDDGSSDATGAILDKLAKGDARMHVLHVPNGGAPAARNKALELAQGTYVAFFDADDWAEPTMLSREVEAAEKTAAELVVAGFYIDTFYTDQDCITEQKCYPACVFADSTSFRQKAHVLFDANLLYTPWNKLFVRSRIEELHVRFQDTFWDDFPFVLDYIRDVSRVTVLEECFYHFERARSESETSRFRKGMYEKREEEQAWLEDLYSHWKLLEDSDVQEFLSRRYVERLLGCLENACNDKACYTKSERLGEVQKILNGTRVAPAFQNARIRAFHTRLLLVPIKKGWKRLSLLEGRFLSRMRRKHIKQFATYKAKR